MKFHSTKKENQENTDGLVWDANIYIYTHTHTHASKHIHTHTHILSWNAQTIIYVFPRMYMY